MSNKVCVIPGCNKPTSSRSSKTCGPEHALLNRKLSFHSSMDNLPDVGEDGKRECAFGNCHNRFKPLRKNQKYCSEDHYAYCQNPDCGKEFKVKKDKLKNPPIACSPSCATKLGHTKESQQRRRENSLKKWGTENPLQADEVKRKIRKTIDSDPSKDYRIGTQNYNTVIKQKYGEEITNVSQLDFVKKRKAKSNLSSRGVDNPMKADDVKAKVRETNLLKYGVPTALNLPKNKEKAALATSTYANSVLDGEESHAVSKINKKFSDLLKQKLPVVEVHYEEVMPCKTSRIDLKVTNPINGKTVLVDLNPTISHNSIKSFQCALSGCDSETIQYPHGHSKPVSEDYSMNRAMDISNNLPETNYIQVWDWDDKDGVINLIKRELRINIANDNDTPSLRCSIVDSSLAKDKLKQWTGSSLNYFNKSEEIYYGIYSDDSLAAVATFQNLHDDVWAMYNNGFDPAVRLPGLQTLIYKKFKEDHNPSKTFLFIDMSKNTKPTNPMASAGFTFYKITGPTPVWFNVKSKELKVDLHGTEDKSFMINNGFTLIYTPGLRVFKAV